MSKCKFTFILAVPYRTKRESSCYKRTISYNKKPVSKMQFKLSIFRTIFSAQMFSVANKKETFDENMKSFV